MTYHIIAVEESDSTVGIYDPDTLKEVARIETGTWPHEIALDKNRKTAFVTNFGIKDYDEHIGQPGASISILDLELMAERDRLYTFETGEDFEQRRAPHAVLIDERRNSLLVNVEAEDTLLRYDLGAENACESSLPPKLFTQETLESFEGGEVVASLPKGTHTMILSQDASRLYIGCGPSGLFELDAETGEVLRSLDCGGAVRGLGWSWDKTQLLVSASGDLCIVDVATLDIIKRYPTGTAQLLYPTPTPDGRYVLVPAVWEGMVMRITLGTGQVESMITGSDPIHIIIPQGGDAAFVGHGRSKWILRFDWSRFLETGRIPTRGGANGLEWAPARTRPLRETLKIGAVIPLTGPSYREGQDLRLGYEYWMERVNGAGGLVAGGKVYDVELLIRDSRSLIGKPGDPPTAEGECVPDYLKRQAREIVEEGAVALFGSYPSPPHFHLRDAADELGIPLITASAAAPGIYKDGSRNVFGIMSPANGFLNGTFDLLARQEDPPQTAMFVACEDPAATNDAQTTADYITNNLGIDVISEKVPLPDVKDRILPFSHNGEVFDEQLNIVEDLKPDVLAMTGHLGESIAFTRALAARNILTKAVVFSVGPAMAAFVNALGPLAENTMGAAMWSSALKAWGHDRFITPLEYRDAFFERFSKEPSHLTAGATACGVVFEEAARRAKATDSISVLNELRDSFEMKSFYSPINLDATGLNSSRGLLTIQLQKGPTGALQHAALWPPSLAGAIPAEAVWPFPAWPDDQDYKDDHNH